MERGGWRGEWREGGDVSNSGELVGLDSSSLGERGGALWLKRHNRATTSQSTSVRGYDSRLSFIGDYVTEFVNN